MKCDLVCLNGGSCMISMFQSKYCECPPEFTGRVCQYGKL